ncbi:MAG TPA: SDR family oxidoreductase [bacterium]|nr:SDR family oxidoreductase [bacterium]
MNPVSNLSRPIVLITGAARGLGAVLVRELIPDFRIWVAVRSRRQCDELRGTYSSTPGPERWFHGNLSRPETIRRIAATSRREGECIYGIVHCPGPIEYTRRVIPDWDVWKGMFEGNVAGAVHLIRILGPTLDNGRIVLLGFSGNGRPRGYRCIAAYAAAKEALAIVACSAAKDLASRKTTVNVLAPGVFLDESGNVPAEGRRLVSEIPMKRPGRDNDITGPVRWLLSDRSAYVTGQIIKVSGGLHI